MNPLIGIKGRLGGTLYDGDRRWLGSGPGHSRGDRSLSAKLCDDGRVLVHSFANDPFSECLDYLGLGRDQTRPRNPAAQRRAAEHRERERLEVLRKIEHCIDLWAEAMPGAGTPVEIYLKSSRRLPISTVPETLRFHPSINPSYPWSEGATRSAPGPAMVAAVVDDENRLTGLHVTPLDKEGCRADRNKIILGAVKGSSVRLTPFSTTAEVIAVAEGIETALGYAVLKGIPTWAALSAGGLQNWICPFEPSRVFIAADTDDSGAGMTAAKSLAERLRCLHDVVIDPAPNGFDWADVAAGGRPVTDLSPVLDFPRSSRFTREQFGEIEPLSEEWLLKGVLPAQGVGFLCGPRKSRKSFYAISLAAAIASGSAFCCREPSPRGVLYVAAEGGNGVRKRIKALRMVHGITCAQLELIAQAPNLRSEVDVQDLEATLRDAARDMERNGHPLGLVVIDTLAASTHGGDENSSSDMGGVMSVLQEMADQLRVMLLVVAHTGKDESRGIRGWSGQYAGADVVLTVVRDKEDSSRSIVTVDKLKDAEDGAKFAFRLQTAVLGIDEDGEPVTSAVCQFEDAPASRSRRRHTLTPNERQVLGALHHLLEADLGQFCPMSCRSLISNGHLHNSGSLLWEAQH